jgi:hypothetical protein
VSPTHLSFQAAPGATAPQSFTITNTGTGPLTVDVNPPKHSPPFSETNGGDNIVIPVGGMRVVSIGYAPTHKGTTHDDIMIFSDDPTQKKAINVKLKGKAK